MSAECRECSAGLEHCHGAIIFHPCRRAECTEDGCDSPEAVEHSFRIDCEAVGCRCAEVSALAV